MDTALHHGDWYRTHFTDDKLARMSHCSRERKVGDFGEGDARGPGQPIRKSTQAAAQHETDARPQLRLRENVFCGAVCEREFLASNSTLFPVRSFHHDPDN
jgi:hypothetical protein